MKAVGVQEAGPPESLTIVEMADPVTGRGEVVIDVNYSGVNRGDVLRRKRGMFPSNAVPPYILGFEGTGTIAQVGQQVHSLQLGQRVGFLVENGGYAQKVRVPSTQVFSIPENLADTAVAGAICVGTTAWHLLRLAAIRPGQNVLIHAGAGGVGSALVQLCRRRSVNIIATVGSEEKVEYVNKLDANMVINYNETDFAAEVLSETNGVGVDVILDCIGKDVAHGNFRCLTSGGLLIYYGSASGHPNFPGDKILANSLRIQGFVIFAMFQRPALWSCGISALLDALSEDNLSLPTRVIPMEEAAAAHRMIEERGVTNRIILDMR